MAWPVPEQPESDEICGAVDEVMELSCTRKVHPSTYHQFKSKDGQICFDWREVPKSATMRNKPLEGWQSGNAADC